MKPPSGLSSCNYTPILYQPCQLYFCIQGRGKIHSEDVVCAHLAYICSVFWCSISLVIIYFPPFIPSSDSTSCSSRSVPAHSISGRLGSSVFDLRQNSQRMVLVEDGQPQYFPCSSSVCKWWENMDVWIKCLLTTSPGVIWISWVSARMIYVFCLSHENLLFF